MPLHQVANVFSAAVCTQNSTIYIGNFGSLIPSQYRIKSNFNYFILIVSNYVSSYVNPLAAMLAVVLEYSKYLKKILLQSEQFQF